MHDDSLGAAWYELRRLAALLAEAAARITDLEHRLDAMNNHDPKE
jgi:hypothetical protein